MVDADGKLQLGISPVWQSLLRWETLKTAADRPQQERMTEGSAPGVTEQQDASLRAQRRGTLVEFLDEFERMSLKFPAHRELVVASKKAAKQLRENCWLGMLMADYDWSENGLIAAARQIQSEYWCLKYFSLFITIVSYLVPDSWHDQASAPASLPRSLARSLAPLLPCSLALPPSLPPTSPPPSLSP